MSDAADAMLQKLEAVSDLAMKHGDLDGALLMAELLRSLKSGYPHLLLDEWEILRKQRQ